jgi:hypothetical protein
VPPSLIQASKFTPALLPDFNVPYVGTQPPAVEDVWVVVPLSRPEMLPRVRENLSRQRFRARVCVVENGAAVGVCEAQGFVPDALLSSETHQSAARNEALFFLREKHPDAYWVSMDDDDYYGAEYVAEHAGLAKRGRMVGKSTHWVLFEGRFLALFRPWSSSGGGRHHCNGATIGAFVSESPEFSMRDVGEDGIFTSTFRARGGKIWMSSPYHTAYCRRGDGRKEHTFMCADKDLIRVMGPRCLVFPQDRLDLVNGENSIEGGTLYEHPKSPFS